MNAIKFRWGVSLGMAVLWILLAVGTVSAQDPCWGLNRWDCNEHPNCEHPYGVYGHCYYISHTLCECRELSAVISNTCDLSAELYEGLFDFEYDSGQMTNDYDQYGACTGYNSPGTDAVAYVDLAPGGQVIAHMQPLDSQTFDASLYLVTDCADPEGSCVVGSDVTFGGEMEEISYTSIDGGVYYIIFDAFYDPDPAMVHVWGEVVGSSTPTQNMTWSLIKSLYR